MLLSSSRVVLEANERGENFYKTLRDLVEKMYIISFHLQYKNQSNDSKNKILFKLQEEFLENWSMRHARLLIEKTYNNKKEGLKKKYSFNVFLQLYIYITTKKSFINMAFVIFSLHLSI